MPRNTMPYICEFSSACNNCNESKDNHRDQDCPGDCDICESEFLEREIRDGLFDMSVGEPSQAVIMAAQTYYIADWTYCQLKPMLDGVRREILARHQFSNRGTQEAQMRGFQARNECGTVSVKTVTEPDEIHELGTYDMITVCREEAAWQNANGFAKINGEGLIVANNIRIRAEVALCAAVESRTGFNDLEIKSLADGAQLLKQYVAQVMAELMPYIKQIPEAK